MIGSQPAVERRPRAAARTPARGHPQGRLPVFLFHDFLDVHLLSYLQICTTLSGRTALLRVQHSAYRKPSSSCKRLGVGRVPEERALAPHLHQVLVLELFQMMRKGRSGNPQLALDVAHDQAVRMRRKQKLHDAQPRLRPHRREHIGVFGNVHISMLVEIWNCVNREITRVRHPERWVSLTSSVRLHEPAERGYDRDSSRP